MFRTLIYPSSGACDCVDELPHRSSCSQFIVLELLVRLVLSGARVAGWSLRTENKTTDVIQQHSRKLLMMDILMSETCWTHKKRNKKASDIKLVFHSWTHFLFSNSSRKSSCLWDNVENFVRDGESVDDVIRNMRFACCISKDANTHWEYAIVISFLRRQWLHECASMLRYTYTCVTSLFHRRKRLSIALSNLAPVLSI